MANTVYLHVGTPKSGTTYVQGLLKANKQRLAEQAGLLYPGRTWNDQVRAVREAIGANPHGQDAKGVEGAWTRLTDEMSAWDGNAIVSMEWLGTAGTPKARWMVETLQPSRVEIIVTARDIARTIPAAWQEFVQNWHTWPWDEFVTAVTSENPRATPAGRLFWVQQDLGRILAVWKDVLPADQLHLVTLPPPGAPATELWGRFASVLGVDPRRFDATGGGGNESLGLESTELMLRLNRASLLSNVSWDVYREAFKGVLAKRGLSGRKPGESAVALPDDVSEWLKSYAAEQAEVIRASGAHVVGDLSDLEPRPAPGGVLPEALPDAAVLEAAVAGLVFLGENRTKEIQRLRTTNAQLRKQLGDQRRRLDSQRKRLAQERRGVTDARGSENTWATRLRRAYRRGSQRMSKRIRGARR